MQNRTQQNQNRQAQHLPINPLAQIIQYKNNKQNLKQHKPPNLLLTQTKQKKR